jgi:hypothetical protein
MKYKRQLENFPVEVVEKMLEYQKAQGNAPEVSVFENNKCAGLQFGGFEWWKTPEREDFWNQVIGNSNFDLFFEKYPKGKLIGYKLSGIASWNQICSLLSYAMPHKDKKHDLFFDKYSINSPLFKRVEALGILDLWFTPVYSVKEEEPKLIRHKMHADNGDFELEISSNGICYRPDSAWLSPSNIGDIVHLYSGRAISFSREPNKDSFMTGRYETVITKMDVGCKKGTLVSDWQKVLELYYEMIK